MHGARSTMTIQRHIFRIEFQKWRHQIDSTSTKQLGIIQIMPSQYISMSLHLYTVYVHMLASNCCFWCPFYTTQNVVKVSMLPRAHQIHVLLWTFRSPTEGLSQHIVQTTSCCHLWPMDAMEKLCAQFFFLYIFVYALASSNFSI